MSTDPITLEVLRGRFDTAANEMELTLLKTAHSMMINQALDATSALFDHDGRTLAQAVGAPGHLGMMIPAMREIVREYPPGIARNGDVYILNDPHHGGSHLPDIVIAMPIVVDERLIGYAVTMAHHTDVGGAAPGSTAVHAVDIHAEGLLLPLLKLGTADGLNPDILAIVESNSRNPAVIIGDLEAQIAAGRTGVHRLVETCREWGTETVVGAMADLMDYSEARTRADLASIPDGEYTFSDYVDDDGITDEPILITVTTRVSGDSIHIDFTGSSTQVQGAMNCTLSATLSAILYVVRAITDHSIPDNDGCHRPITYTLPAGSVVNATYPAPVGARSIVFKRVVDVLTGSLALAVPARLNAAGSGQGNLVFIGGGQLGKVEPLGVPFAGGMGARSSKDGIDVIESGLSNSFNVPTEVIEARLPLRIEHLRLWQDSGGAGQYRGGLGYHTAVRWLGPEAIVTTRRDRHKYQPWGLFGGGSAPSCRYVLHRSSGESYEVSSKTVFRIQEGDLFEIWTTGGGGYGSPLDRDPLSVVDDVRDGRVSEQQAHDVYGVVLRDGEVDAAATDELRRVHRNGQETGSA